MKQRLHIARTLLHDPEVLFLDEPTIGLDPVGARELRQVVRDLQAEKKTILLTTHYMFEADALCQRMAVINHGRIIALDTPGRPEDATSADLSVIEIEVFGMPAGGARAAARPALRRYRLGGKRRPEADAAGADAARLRGRART